MLFSALFFIISYLHCRFEFQLSKRVDNNFTKQWLTNHPLKRRVTIRQSDKITAPLTYGFFRPVILMPEKTDWNDSTQLSYILLHEFFHIRHCDMVLKLIVAAALCIHWFNPMVWVMYILFNRDIELACDEGVVKQAGINEKSVYARMLIHMEEKKKELTPLCNNFSKNAIEERITAIMKIKKTKVISMIIAGMIIWGTVGIFATSAAASSNGIELAVTGNGIDGEVYSIYEPFGLTVDKQAGKMYYEDKLVRCFDDQFPGKNFNTKAIGYYEKNGVIDVRAVREKGTNELTGLAAASQEEFENRVIVDHTQAVSKDTADMFSAYEEFGLEYDESQKAFFYQDKRVRLFWDSRSVQAQPSDSEKPFINTVSNWDQDGEIDLYTVRDFKQTDKDGYGKLMEMHIASQEEFEENTKNFSDQSNSPEEIK